MKTKISEFSAHELLHRIVDLKGLTAEEIGPQHAAEIILAREYQGIMNKIVPASDPNPFLHRNLNEKLTVSIEEDDEYIYATLSDPTYAESGIRVKVSKEMEERNGEIGYIISTMHGQKEEWCDG